MKKRADVITAWKVKIEAFCKKEADETDNFQNVQKKDESRISLKELKKPVFRLCANSV